MMAVYKKTVTAYACERCEGEWLPRVQGGELPNVCPKCKSPYWNRPRKGEVGLLQRFQVGLLNKGGKEGGPKLWKIADDHLTFEVQAGYEYEISLEQCQGRPDEVWDWVLQVQAKPWGTPEVVSDLVTAFNSALDLRNGSVRSD